MDEPPKAPRRLQVPGRFVPLWWRRGAGTEQDHVDAPLTTRSRFFYRTLVALVIIGGIIMIVVARR